MVQGGFGKANAAGRGDLLDPSGDVDTVAVEPAVLDEHVAEIDADANLHATVCRQLGIVDAQAALDLDRTPDGRGHGGECRQQAIPGDVDQSPSMGHDEIANDVLIGGQPSSGLLDIVGDQATVPADVGMEASDKSTFSPARAWWAPRVTSNPLTVSSSPIEARCAFMSVLPTR
jgi:hypothetical protein